jgi:DNA-binding GntR family transcriptional regulator
MVTARRTEDATRRIHDELRQSILAGELLGGNELNQAQLAREFGVSRGPVREALRLLQREGLVDTELNKRSTVAPLSVDTIEHAYALRIVSEALAMSVTIGRLGGDELSELDGLAAAIEASGPADYPTWAHNHQLFHQMLTMHAGSPMRETIAQGTDHTERYRRIYVSDEHGGHRLGAAEHREIANACRSLEPGTATRLLGRHLGRAGLSVVSLVDPQHDPVLLRAAIEQVAGAKPATPPLAKQGSGRSRHAPVPSVTQDGSPRGARGEGMTTLPKGQTA